MRTILVIEDLPYMRSIFSRLLREHGFRIVEAADGYEGLQLARTEKPDLILLDLMMPTLDGVEMSQQMRADPQLCRIPVIVVTAFPGMTTPRRARAFGWKDVLPKPFDLGQLLDSISRVLPGTLQPLARQVSA